MKDPQSQQTVNLGDTEWASRSQAHALVLVATTVIGIYICYLLAKPFLPALAWALALAVLFTPLQRRIETKVRRPGVAAALSIFIILVIVVGPAIFVGQRLVAETAKGAAVITEQIKSGEWRIVIKSHPRLARMANWMEQELDLPQIATNTGGWLTGAGASVVKGGVVQVIMFALTFYLLFYFLRDRRAALDSLDFILPFSKLEINRLCNRVTDTIYATIYGTLAVASVQGLLGGLMFWWLGLTAPLLWGVVMALLSIVPTLGAFVIWVPAAIFLALKGSWVKAIILTAWGAIVVGGIDNVLRPILVGNRLRLHTILAFLSVVGGLILFGASGLVLGPLALTVTTVFLEIWRNRIRNEPQAKT